MFKIICGAILCGAYSSVHPAAIKNETQNESQTSVSVTFKKSGGKELKDIIRSILEGKYANPQMIVWYSGEDGLTKRCFDFYQSQLINKLYSGENKNKDWCLYLYDLWAWRGLKCSLDVLLDQKQGMRWLDEHSEVIPSGTFFASLLHNDSFMAAFFKKIMDDTLKEGPRAFIFDKSKTYPDNHQSFIGLFKGYNQGSSCSLLAHPAFLYPKTGTGGFKDTAKSYSALQYLEGLWLAIQMIQQNVNNGIRNIQLFFILPTGETDYYRPMNNNQEQNPFCDDLKKLVKWYYGKVHPRVDIHFLEFDYTHQYRYFNQKERKTKRPYKLVETDTLYEKVMERSSCIRVIEDERTMPSRVVSMHEHRGSFN